MQAIKIWCEYDFGGSFGGNNNEECILPNPNSTTSEEDGVSVIAYLEERTSMSKEELEGLYDWEYITLNTLEKGE